MQVGDIVIINRSFLGEPAGVRAYVYEEYNIGGDPGVSLITENGTDLGGFSEEEQEQYLTLDYHSGLSYQFTNVMKLNVDWSNGYFKSAFRKA